jgi:hypothetical protein
MERRNVALDNPYEELIGRRIDALSHRSARTGTRCPSCVV